LIFENNQELKPCLFSEKSLFSRKWQTLCSESGGNEKSCEHLTKETFKESICQYKQDFRRRELSQSLNQNFVKDVTSRDAMHIHGVSQFDNLPVTNNEALSKKNLGNAALTLICGQILLQISCLQFSNSHRRAIQTWTPQTSTIC